MIKKILVFISIAMLSGCVTVPNVNPPPIVVPSNLNQNEVELAILMAVADRAAPPQLSPGQQITDNVLSSVISGYDSVSRPRQNWYFEDRKPGTVFAGFQSRNFYMRVAVSYDKENVKMNIIESRNLRQTETRIHKKAFLWLSTLESRVRRSLGTLSRKGYEKSES